ncbi:hypothetical protein PCE1_004018 [Barthelona sp. PCE]
MSFEREINNILKLFKGASQWSDLVRILTKLYGILTASKYDQFDGQHLPMRYELCKRISQCLNHKLPSGVHEQALKCFDAIYTKIGSDNLSAELPIYILSIFSLYQHATMTVRPIIAQLFSTHLVPLGPRLGPCLTPLLTSILPGIEEESSETYGEIMELLDALLSGCGAELFFSALFRSVGLSPSTRFSGLQYIIQRFKEPSLISPIIVSEALIGSLSSFDSLVIRSGLDVILNFGDEILTFSDDEKLNLLVALLRILSSGDVSLLRRVWQVLNEVTLPPVTVALERIFSTPLQNYVAQERLRYKDEFIKPSKEQIMSTCAAWPAEIALAIVEKQATMETDFVDRKDVVRMALEYGRKQHIESGFIALRTLWQYISDDIWDIMHTIEADIIGSQSLSILQLLLDNVILLCFSSKTLSPKGFDEHDVSHFAQFLIRILTASRDDETVQLVSDLIDRVFVFPPCSDSSNIFEPSLGSISMVGTHSLDVLRCFTTAEQRTFVFDLLRSILDEEKPMNDDLELILKLLAVTGNHQKEVETEVETETEASENSAKNDEDEIVSLLDKFIRMDALSCETFLYITVHPRYFGFGVWLREHYHAVDKTTLMKRLAECLWETNDCIAFSQFSIIHPGAVSSYLKRQITSQDFNIRKQSLERYLEMYNLSKTSNLQTPVMESRSLMLTLDALQSSEPLLYQMIYRFVLELISEIHSLVFPCLDFLLSSNLESKLHSHTLAQRLDKRRIKYTFTILEKLIAISPNRVMQVLADKRSENSLQSKFLGLYLPESQSSHDKQEFLMYFEDYASFLVSLIIYILHLAPTQPYVNEILSVQFFVCDFAKFILPFIPETVLQQTSLPNQLHLILGNLTTKYPNSTLQIEILKLVHSLTDSLDSVLSVCHRGINYAVTNNKLYCLLAYKDLVEKLIVEDKSASAATMLSVFITCIKQLGSCPSDLLAPLVELSSRLITSILHLSDNNKGEEIIDDSNIILDTVFFPVKLIFGIAKEVFVTEEEERKKEVSPQEALLDCVPLLLSGLTDHWIRVQKSKDVGDQVKREAIVDLLKCIPLEVLFHAVYSTWSGMSVAQQIPIVNIDIVEGKSEIKDYPATVELSEGQKTLIQLVLSTMPSFPNILVRMHSLMLLDRAGFDLAFHLVDILKNIMVYFDTEELRNSKSDFMSFVNVLLENITSSSCLLLLFETVVDYVIICFSDSNVRRLNQSRSARMSDAFSSEALSNSYVSFDPSAQSAFTENDEGHLSVSQDEQRQWVETLTVMFRYFSLILEGRKNWSPRQTRKFDAEKNAVYAKKLCWVLGRRLPFFLLRTKIFGSKNHVTLVQMLVSAVLPQLSPTNPPVSYFFSSLTQGPSSWSKLFKSKAFDIFLNDSFLCSATLRVLQMWGPIAFRFVTSCDNAGGYDRYQTLDSIIERLSPGGVMTKISATADNSQRYMLLIRLTYLMYACPNNTLPLPVIIEKVQENIDSQCPSVTSAALILLRTMFIKNDEDNVMPYFPIVVSNILRILDDLTINNTVMLHCLKLLDTILVIGFQHVHFYQWSLLRDPLMPVFENLNDYPVTVLPIITRVAFLLGIEEKTIEKARLESMRSPLLSVAELSDRKQLTSFIAAASSHFTLSCRFTHEYKVDTVENYLLEDLLVNFSEKDPTIRSITKQENTELSGDSYEMSLL